MENEEITKIKVNNVETKVEGDIPDVDLTKEEVVTEEKTVEEETITVEQVIEKESKVEEPEEEVIGSVTSFLNNFKSYISSDKFDKQAGDMEKKYGIPKRKAKSGFIMAFLGTLSDTLHIAIEFAEDALTTAIGLINKVLMTITTFSMNGLRKLVRIITLNKSHSC